MSYVIDLLSIIYFLIAISATGSTMVEAMVSVLLLVVIIINQNWKLKLSHPASKFLLVFLLLVSAEIMISGNIPFAYLLSRLSMFMPIFIFIYYKDSPKSKKMLCIVLGIWLAVSVRATYLMGTGKMAARYIAAHVQEAKPFSGGGYALAIALALLGVFLLDLYLWGKSKKVYHLVFCILLFAVVILTQSTITVIAMIIGVFSSVCFRLFSISTLKGITRRHIVGLVLLFCVCVGFYLLKDHFGQALISYALPHNDNFSRRLVELGHLLSGSGVMSAETSDSADRVMRMLSSLQSFLEYPILGITRVVGTNHYLQAAYGVGSHGELFDSLARFGLVAGIPYLGIFLSGIAYERSLQTLKIGFGYIITFVFLITFNPFLYSSVNCVLFFVIPLIITLREQQLNEREYQ